MARTDACPPYVYRYIPIHRLWQMLSNKKLYFMRNTKWEDPFEGFLLKRYCRGKNKEYADLIKDKFFLCCSLSTERDQFWRIYTPNKDGVVLRIKTSELNKLDKSITCRMVKYTVRKDIQTILDKMPDDLTQDQVVRMLYIKRVAFQDENEFRFLIQKSNIHDDIIEISMKDPDSVISRVTFDPRIDTRAYRDHKAFIEKTYGLSDIRQSDLYNPERSFKHNGKWVLQSV